MFAVVPRYCFGANLKQLKVRMRSVESIKKITKAMKMIAATKARVEVNIQNIIHSKISNYSLSKCRLTI